MTGKPNAELGSTLKQEPAHASVSENEWYYLNRCRQVGPFSQSELQVLLAKEVISSSTLVRTQDGCGWRPLRELSNEPAEPNSRRSNWKFAALFIIPFVMGIVAAAPKGVEHLTTTVKTNSPEPFAKAKDHDRLPKVEALLPKDFIKGRISTSSLDGSVFMFNAVRPALPYKALLSPERQSELEFWRSITHSSHTDLYMLYLRRYPFGRFPEVAKTEIRPSKQMASVGRPEYPTAKRKNSPSRAIASKRLKRKTAKTRPVIPGRCSTANIVSCREACRRARHAT
jgi:hypothetical protein